MLIALPAQTPNKPPAFFADMLDYKAVVAK
jgi:hypothetical protein